MHQSTPGAFEQDGQFYKNVEDVRAKDLVLSWNEKTGAFEFKPVVQNFIRTADKIYQLTYEDRTVIETTWSHPFYIEGKGWVKAEELRAGDLSKTDKGILRIAKVHVDVRSEEVYNFEVAENHTYLVTDQGVVVHNAEYPDGFLGEVVNWHWRQTRFKPGPASAPQLNKSGTETWRNNPETGMAEEDTQQMVDEFLAGEEGREWLKTQDGQDFLKTETGKDHLARLQQLPEESNPITSVGGLEGARSSGIQWTVRHENTEINLRNNYDYLWNPGSFDHLEYQGFRTPFFGKTDVELRNEQREAYRVYFEKTKDLYEIYKEKLRHGARDGRFFEERQGIGYLGWGPDPKILDWYEREKNRMYNEYRDNENKRFNYPQGR